MLKAIAFALFVLTFATSADAFHRDTHKRFTLGVPVNISTLACDTEEQVNIILTEQKKSVEAAMQAITLFMQIPNEKGEPSCLIGQLGGVIPLEVMSKQEGIVFPDGVKTVYVIRVGYPDSNVSFFIVSLVGVDLAGEPA